MSYTPSADNLLLGAGALFFDRFKNGQKTGERHFGNVTSFTIATADDVKELYSSMDASRGLLKAATTKRTMTMKITGNEFSKENVALNLMGDLVKLTQEQGTLTDVTITAKARKGCYYAVGQRNISDVTVKVGATTKTEGTDYTVDARSGRIYIVPTGTIADDATVVASCSYAAMDVEAIAGGVSSTIEGYLRFVADPTAGPAYEVEVWAVQLSSDGEMGLISDDFGDWTLTARVLTRKDEHPNAPYFVAIPL